MKYGTQRSRRVLGCAAMLACSFVAGTVLAPIAAPGLYALYAPLCHQMPERSLMLGDAAQAVCARCAGLYLGGASGLVLAAWLVTGRARRLHPLWLAVACAPTAVDVAAHWIAGAGLPNLPRLLLAWPAGFVAARFLAIGLVDLFQQRPRSEVVEAVDG